MRTVVPVLLCGGSGTRLWPLSRNSYPKQFATLSGNKSLYQSTLALLQSAGVADPLIVTRSALRFIARDQLKETSSGCAGIMVEPAGRNTAPAVLAAALWLQKTRPEALMMVAPSDHVIPANGKFAEAIEGSLAAARAGQIITFGIVPTSPETGYGWLELADSAAMALAEPSKLVAFKEKPTADVAQAMLDEGRFLWNSGIFLFSVETILAAYAEHAPDLVETVTQAVAGAKNDYEFINLASDAWEETRDISIDFAIMEKASNLSVMPYDGGWNDLGSWEAVMETSPADANGNVTAGDAVLIDSKNSMVRAESPRQAVVGIGLENIIAVAMPDAVLISKVGAGQSVKEAVAILKARGVKQVADFPVDHRPWGWFESLATGNRFQVKRIVVKPGAALSLQSHHHRAEHWIVVEGTAKVTIGDTARLVTENQSVYIPLGEKHRLENPGKVDMVLVEVQTGTYFGEDDIIRYQDIYDRS